jgi:rare lipoprotein A
MSAATNTLRVATITLIIAIAQGAGPYALAADSPAEPAAKSKLAPDRTGKKRVGKASFYADHFAGKTMADGTPMDPQDDNAASRTLPLGTTAKVTNLKTGQSAVVTIQDRGPYVDGRIVDLSPSTAREIGLSRREGITDVEVEPIAVPMPDGSVKPGVAAEHDAPRRGWFDWFR